MGVVAKGATLLDEQLGPGWEDEINLETLDLEDACMCVLGQVFAPGTRARRLASRRGISVRRRSGFSVGCEFFEEPDYEVGFDIGDEVLDYGRLTGIWKRLIQGRRAKAAEEE